MTEKKPKKAPTHLSREAKSWWRDIVAAYEIDDEGGHLLLATALEAFDRMRGAQAEIKRDGATVLDRFEQRKAHPAIQTERDSRAAMMTALRMLNLDVTPKTRN